MGEISDQLTAARNQAFQRYGDIATVGAPGAQCTVSVNSNLVDDAGAPLGLIGEFPAVDDAAFDDVLAEATAWLCDHGCQRMLGPIVRHTWYPFRAVVNGFDAMPQLTGEPWNSPKLPLQMAGAGFNEVAWYVSTRTEDPTGQLAAGEQALTRLLAAGYTLRGLDLSRLQDDLRTIWGVTNRAFAPPVNYLFHPIEFDEFQLVLGPSSALLDDELIRFCVAPSGEVVAFVYGTAEAGQTLCVKTLAVVPEARGKGVGTALVADLTRVCVERGFRNYTHGLMRMGGPSTTISSKGESSVFRRYVVMERIL